MADYNPNNPYNQQQNNQSQSTQSGGFSSQNSGAQGPVSNESRDEQLRRLGQQLNKNPNKKKKNSKWIIIILILLLIGLAGFAVWYFLQNKADIDPGSTIRISMDVPKEIEGVVGDIYKLDNRISPGDKYDVVCKARNANNFGGDSATAEDQTSIYLRFKVVLIVDGVEYQNMVIPNPVSSLWHIYNKDEETSDYVWDNYYYYYGKLNYNASVELFNTLTFDFEKIPNEFGGKSGQIIITIEAVEANKEIIGVSGGAWESAPKRWSDNMKNGVNNNGQAIEV